MRMPRIVTSLMRIDPVVIIFAVLFMAVYSAVVLYMVGPQSDCLSVSDFTAQLQRYELRLNAAGLLHKLSSIQTENDVDGALSDGDKMTDIEVGHGDRQRRNASRSDEASSARSKKQTKRSHFVYDSMPASDLLNSDFTPNIVYYVWCGPRWFEFLHYLSVRSVIRQLRPDNIVFLYDTAPIVDDWIYNTWYSELAAEYPFFRPYHLDPTKEPACVGHSQPNVTFMLGLLTNTGGMYINEHTILADYPLDLRKLDIVLATNPLSASDVVGEAVPAVLATRMGKPGISAQTLRTHLNDLTSKKTRQLSCSTIEGYTNAHRKPICVSSAATARLFPRDIWNRGDSFGRLARTIFYGTPAILQPTPTYDELIPNIAHIVWLGGGEMDFLFYLCVTSLVYVAQVDAVYIHGNGPPGGGYWHLVKDNPKVHLIYRDYPRTIYGTPVNVVSHVTDIWRVDFMIKYGGIYVDTDTVFVRPLDRTIRGYDAVGSYDWTYWNHPFPDTINFGVALGKRNAPYWHKFQESMKWFKDQDWSWNGLRQPYRIQERHPDLVLIDPHLQVICYLAKCHPTWWPNYHNESIDHLNSNSIRNWRNETFAFHWTLPTPFELKDHVNLLTTDTMFSEIGKYVLEKAGTLEYFQKVVRSNSGTTVARRP